MIVLAYNTIFQGFIMSIVSLYYNFEMRRIKYIH